MCVRIPCLVGFGLVIVCSSTSLKYFRDTIVRVVLVFQYTGSRIFPAVSAMAGLLSRHTFLSLVARWRIAKVGD